MTDKPTDSYSVIIPCKNEEDTIEEVISGLKSLDFVSEIIVVNDGSTDGTAEILDGIQDINIVTHIYSKGNGAAVKAGARAASGSILIFMDADGQHQPDNIKILINFRSSVSF